MRNCVWYTLIALHATAWMISCDNTLAINGNYREQIVVYGLLDHGLDTNYLRIQRSFLGENTSALELAADAGENFYAESDLTVYLEQWMHGSMVGTIPCTYVDGDSLGIDKPEGIFAASPNILYRAVATIDTLSTYRLKVIHHINEDTITATTDIVQSFYLYYPTRPEVLINYADTGKITYTCKQAVHAMLYDLIMTFRYAEKNTVTGDSAVQEVSWKVFSNKIGTNTDGNSNISFSVDKRSFFTFVSSALDPDPQLTRYFLELQFDWYAGGMELYDQYINMLANLGLNQDYISPEYTNINGGIGIFSSRHLETAAPVFLSDDTLDSLACGSITKQLGFVSSPSNPNYPGCTE